MQFSVLNSCLLAVAGLSTAVLAQTVGFDVVSQPQSGDVLTAGKPYTIKWTPGGASGTVSILLLQGKTNTTLELGNTIGHGIQSSAGQYVWASVPSSPEYPLYGLKIELDSDPTTFQYSSYFTIGGGNAAAHDDVASPSSSAASSAAAASVSSSIAVSSSAAPVASKAASSAPASSVYAMTTASAPVATSAYPATTLSTSLRNSSEATSSATATGSANATATTTPAHTGAAGNTIASGATLVGAVLFSVVLLI